MMKLALARCFKAQVVKGVLIDPLASNKKAHNFYRKFGFKFVEVRMFGKDCCHVHYLDQSDYKPDKSDRLCV